jgi:rSAM/selenodomain-associated transferase 1
MMLVCNSVILIFAKAPVAGQVKTRLVPVLGEYGAAEIYRLLLYRLIHELKDGNIADTEICCMPDMLHPDFQHIQALIGCSLSNQVGSDLGQRMSNAVKKALRRYQYVILIGADCPGISINYLKQAVCYLKEGADAILGPAEDGGYVLLGLSNTATCLFDGLPWGTGKILEITRNCFRSLNWKWQELPELWDVDRPEDLERFKRLMQKDYFLTI